MCFEVWKRKFGEKDFQFIQKSVLKSMLYRMEQRLALDPKILMIGKVFGSFQYNKPAASLSFGQ